MGDSNTRKIIYETQRQARGGERPPVRSLWRRRLLLGGGGLVLLAGDGGGYFIWHAFTHVTISQARVHAAVMALCSEVDPRMREICVEPGQTVRKGQPVFRLDDSEFRVALEAAEAGRSLAQARVIGVRIALELRQIRLPEEIRRAEAEYNAEEARLVQLKKGARAEEIEAAKLVVASAKAQTEILASDVEWTKKLIEAKYEAPRTLEVQKIQLARQLNAARQAELALTQLIAGPAVEQIRAAEQTLAARDAALALARTGEKGVEALRSDLAAREAELKQAESDVTKCRAALHRMTILSPVEGTVLRTFVHEGELCRRGATAALVSDDTKGRWIEGMVRESDAAYLRSGQSARVEIIAGSGQHVNAKVEAIAVATSSVGNSDGEAIGATARLAGPELVWVKLRPVEQKGNPLPGMTATATIRIR